VPEEHTYSGRIGQGSRHSAVRPCSATCALRLGVRLARGEDEEGPDAARPRSETVEVGEKAKRGRPLDGQ
jgi:hypothetical protein